MGETGLGIPCSFRSWCSLDASVYDGGYVPLVCDALRYGRRETKLRMVLRVRNENTCQYWASGTDPSVEKFHLENGGTRHESSS